MNYARRDRDITRRLQDRDRGLRNNANRAAGRSIERTVNYGISPEASSIRFNSMSDHLMDAWSYEMNRVAHGNRLRAFYGDRIMNTEEQIEATPENDTGEVASPARSGRIRHNTRGSTGHIRLGEDRRHGQEREIVRGTVQVPPAEYAVHFDLDTVEATVDPQDIDEPTILNRTPQPTLRRHDAARAAARAEARQTNNSTLQLVSVLHKVLDITFFINEEESVIVANWATKDNVYGTASSPEMEDLLDQVNNEIYKNEDHGTDEQEEEEWLSEA